MPTLSLDRTIEITAHGETATVICEPREKVSRGWCARIAINPANPYGLWDRDYLKPRAIPHGERPLDVHIFEDLEAGYYEAHSIFRSRRPISVYFEVTASGGIEILGTSGDEDAVIVRLNGMTPEEVQAARAVSEGADGLPPLRGTVKQVAMAEPYRRIMLEYAGKAGDGELSARILEIRDSPWFIKNINRTLAEVKTSLGLAPRLPRSDGARGQVRP